MLFEPIGKNGKILDIHQEFEVFSISLVTGLPPGDPVESEG
jgi:hypothetical protein